MAEETRPSMAVNLTAMSVQHLAGMKGLALAALIAAQLES